jgi:anaphase-promoting complex subunit 1
VQQQLTPLLSGSLPVLLDRLAAAAASQSTSGQPRSNTAAVNPNQGSTATQGSSNRPMSVAAATAVVEAHVAALVGACMAIGFRFAGSCHAPAESLLRHYALQLLAAKRRMGVGPEAGVAGTWGKLDRGMLEGAVCNVMVALSCVMAGSGHLPTFRLLQHLR